MLSEPAALPRRAAFGLPPTAQLLTEGGDARIAIPPGAAANRYGCAPFPDPAIAAFGSSTASTISRRGFAAADRLREHLVAADGSAPRAAIYARELDRLRAELKTLCGIADLAGLDIVFAASGTDLHLLAAQLAGGTRDAPLRSIMVDPRETGSGVAGALAGRHFSAQTALGAAVEAGVPIAGGSIAEIVTIALRDEAGGLRPEETVTAEVDALTVEAARHGRRALLTLVDVSKTGIIAPSPSAACALVRRLPQTVEILVDACQFRLAPASLRAYLESGFMVALTGSKFLTGPAFAGALLVPGAVARRLRLRRLSPALRAYSARADWPMGWAARNALPEQANYGLLLRWEAAIAELRALRAVPDPAIAEFLRDFARAVARRLATDPLFESLPTPRLDRQRLAGSESWDSVTTIFPFRLRHSAPGRSGAPFSASETAEVYRWLRRDASGVLSPIDIAGLRCELGQPVPCGTLGGIETSALRLCASARLITEAAAPGGTEAVIERAMRALDKTALLAAAVSRRGALDA